ncbi:membrane protein [Longimycelium tulufanense]|uniref:Membrane protein n=1 Tax=Longimycelium tulufanense TaxID=907463 RepID=A0A8J3FW34_9PSEU|nr:Bax inhibitor-1/YccA family protein [Longimycelium tulufanense]GGM68656.1 membrane protein [Longimycelium tulufanense]
MRTTSNPAFRNLPSGGGYATFQDQPSTAQGYPYAAGPVTTERPMTIDDVVTKTGITAGAALLAGIATAYSGAVFLALPALIIGLVLSLIIIFKQSANPGLILGYSIAEGVLLGAITVVFDNFVSKGGATSFLEGLGFQAIVGTGGVFAGMLIVYKTGAIRVTPKLTRWIVGATIGVFVLMLANLVTSFFNTGGLGLRDGSPLAIGFSLLVIGVAAFSLLLDFDAADQAIRSGTPSKYAWYIAFGLMTTLVWLYIEIVRLLSYLRQE